MVYCIIVVLHSKFICIYSVSLIYLCNCPLFLLRVLSGNCSIVLRKLSITGDQRTTYQRSNQFCGLSFAQIEYCLYKCNYQYSSYLLCDERALLCTGNYSLCDIDVCYNYLRNFATNEGYDMGCDMLDVLSRVIISNWVGGTYKMWSVNCFLAW